MTKTRTRFLVATLIATLFINIFKTGIERMRANDFAARNTSSEVFGFAPYWTFHNLDKVDFNVLTTLAYFDLKVDETGYIKKDDQGYVTFMSDQATELFKKAHNHGTKVVATLTQLDNDTIESFLNDSQAQKVAIKEAVYLVSLRGIDGVNIDFEYLGEVDPEMRGKFSDFIGEMKKAMARENKNYKVSVSVYASSASGDKLYDIKKISDNSDEVFMMAYDFSTTASDSAEPSAPLYGHKQGKYWYDIATAVDDFLKKMPASKLIVGTPWYGYNMPVEKPEVKAAAYPYGTAQTYGQISDIKPEHVAEYKEGWDPLGQVAWKAYLDEDTGMWRMVFYDDPKALGKKFDFIKEKKLAGVGIWALGFEEDNSDLWDLLKQKLNLNNIAEKENKNQVNEEKNWDKREATNIKKENKKG